MNIKMHSNNIFAVSLGQDHFVNVYVRKGNVAEIEPCSHAEQADISKAATVKAWEAVRDKFSLTAKPAFKPWHQIISYYPQVALALDGHCGFPGIQNESETRSGQAEGESGRYSHPMSVEKNQQGR